MPFIEIITDSKSQTQLNKVITKKMVNDCDILFFKDYRDIFLFQLPDRHQGVYGVSCKPAD